MLNAFHCSPIDTPVLGSLEYVPEMDELELSVDVSTCQMVDCHTWIAPTLKNNNNNNKIYIYIFYYYYFIFLIIYIYIYKYIYIFVLHIYIYLGVF